MELISIYGLTSQALKLVLVASMPPVIAAALVGILVSLLQALTQVQEQTLPFAFKLMAVALTIYAMIGIFGGDFYLYTLQIFDSIQHVSRTGIIGN